MRERYRVGPLETTPGVDIDVEVDAENPDEARVKARPELRARGVPEHDPLVAGRLRPIRGDRYAD